MAYQIEPARVSITPHKRLLGSKKSRVAFNGRRRQSNWTVENGNFRVGRSLGTDYFQVPVTPFFGREGKRWATVRVTETLRQTRCRVVLDTLHESPNRLFVPPWVPGPFGPAGRHRLRMLRHRQPIDRQASLIRLDRAPAGAWASRDYGASRTGTRYAKHRVAHRATTASSFTPASARRSSFAGRNWWGRICS
jgi:hypothetical protein